MRNILSAITPLIITIITTIIFITTPQKNGWSMHQVEGEEEDIQEGPSTKITSQTSNPSVVREENIPPTENEKSSAYSGPQWGLAEEEIEYLFKNSKDFICILEFGGHFKRVNQTWQYLLGWETQELLEIPYINFVHPEDVEKTLKYEKEFMPAGLINRYRCKDESYRWLDWIGLSKTREEPIKNGGYPLTIARDITLQKVIEKGLEERLKKFPEGQWPIKQKVLEAIMEIQTSHFNARMYENERDGANRVSKVILRNLTQLSGSNFGFIGEMISDQFEAPTLHYTWAGKFPLTEPHEEQKTEKKLEGFFNNLIEDSVSKKEPLLINDIKNYSKKIEVPPELPQLKSFLGFPLIANDKLVGIIGLTNCVKDINKTLMEELDPIFSLSALIINERNQKKSEKIAKISFLAHMSHEIRTPLAGLLGMLGLINKEYLHDEDLNYLETAHNSGLSLLNILNDILDASKFEADQLKLESIKFNPVVIVQEVTQLLALDARKKEIELNLIANSQVPLYLMGDPTRFRQIFFNLVGNAIKFTSKGSVTISLGGEYDKNDFTLVGKVIDTGMGISSEIQKKLFKPFSQADTSMLRRSGGTGLGLFITKKLCEMMRGDIEVSSEVDKGSTFRFQVRLGRFKDLMIPVESLFPITLPYKLPNIRILIAEDNVVNQTILRTMLTNAGCSVSTVWNGKEAVEAVAKEHYDIVLMDGEMPVMDGLEATQKIRESFNAQTLPIIAVTAHAMTEDRERFLKAGMNSYLTKPITKETLCNEILKCLTSLERK